MDAIQLKTVNDYQDIKRSTKNKKGEQIIKSAPKQSKTNPKQSETIKKDKWGSTRIKNDQEKTIKVINNDQK